MDDMDRGPGVSADIADDLQHAADLFGEAFRPIIAKAEQARDMAVALEADAARARAFLADLVANYPQTTWAQDHAALDAARLFLAEDPL